MKEDEERHEEAGQGQRQTCHLQESGVLGDVDLFLKKTNMRSVFMRWWRTRFEKRGSDERF